MTRVTLLLGFLGAGVAALFLFLLKHEVGTLEDDLAAIQAHIGAQEEAIHVLEAEWAYLNRPERLATLSRQQLGLTPLGPERLIALEELPLRAAEAAPGLGGSKLAPPAAKPVGWQRRYRRGEAP
jgi:hypothetical protein